MKNYVIENTLGSLNYFSSEQSMFDYNLDNVHYCHIRKYNAKMSVRHAKVYRSSKGQFIYFGCSRYYLNDFRIVSDDWLSHEVSDIILDAKRRGVYHD